MYPTREPLTRAAEVGYGGGGGVGGGGVVGAEKLATARVQNRQTDRLTNGRGGAGKNYFGSPTP